MGANMQAFYRLLALSVVLILLIDFAHARQLYRYKDKNGVTVVKNRLPAEYSQKGYEVLNERFQVIEVVPPAKTAEELKKEAEEKAAEETRKAAAAKAAEEAKQQEAENQKLLQRYASVEDILRTRKSELGSQDVVIGVNNSNIRQIEARLSEGQRKAALLERQGKALPEDLSKAIDKAQKDIDSLRAKNAEQEKKKKTIRDRYVKLLLHFNRLKSKQMMEWNARGILRDRAPNMRIAQCQNNCESLWKKGQAYFNKHNKLGLEFSDKTSLHSQHPKDNKQFGLSLTKIKHEDGHAILFNVICQSSQAGKKLCRAPTTRALADGFIGSLK